MFLIDKPFVSDFLKKTILDNQIPVIDTQDLNELDLYKGSNIISETKAISILKESEYPTLYTNSENSIGWISDNMDFCTLPQKIDLFKDKFKFRTLLESKYPNVYFRKVELDKLKDLNIDFIPFPFIIKPNVGFFSLGVYKVSNKDEWSITLNKILRESEDIKKIYPETVLDNKSFIIESVIEGDEYAVDSYIDDNGKPVILNIHQHLFSSGDDVSDRVYLSSKSIIDNNMEDVIKFLEIISELSCIKNFPLHVEFRRDPTGDLIPIEVNPLRFGGWCTTADATYKAYGFNPYLYFLNKKKPNWDKIFCGKEDKIYSLIVLDNSTGIEGSAIKTFNYKKLLSKFQKPLEIRKINYKKFPIFGFLFTETNINNIKELEYILHSDLTEFI